MNGLHPTQVLYLYRRIIRQSGGTVGLRDEGLGDHRLAETAPPPVPETLRGDGTSGPPEDHGIRCVAPNLLIDKTYVLWYASSIGG